MIRKNPDFHFQLIMLLFVLAVFPLLLFGSQMRLSLMPFARENNFPVWKQVQRPSPSPTPWPTQAPLSYSQPKDQSGINDLNTLVYVSPTPTPTPNPAEVLNLPNVLLGNLFSFLLGLAGKAVSFLSFAISQFGH